MPDKDKTEPKTTQSETSQPAKLFDVADPGKTPALATSRPIIVKHGAMVRQDPMVVNQDTETSEEAPPAKTSNRELKIQPDMPKAEEPEPAAPAETKDEPQPAAQEASGTGAVDSLMNEVDAKQADKKQKKELEERTKELEKSIASKEFFVPIGVESRRRSANRLLWMLIVLLLIGLAGLNFAIDAGILDTGMPALTDIL